MIKVALLGSTGHIGKNLTYYFGKEKNFELLLFSRNEKKLEKTISQFELKNNFTIRKYDEFDNLTYDVVINCVGLSDPAKIETSKGEILETAKTFDTLTLEYLKKIPKTKLINFSSGIVYGGQFSSAVKNTNLIDENFNDGEIKSEYVLAKVRSEIKHRMLKHLNIIDLRLFSFFSRFMDLSSKFLISEVISSIKQNKKLITNEFDFYRDYIHPKDLFLLLKKCINNNPINDVFDLYSKKPIGKFDLLDSLRDNFGLQYQVVPNSGFSSPTGFKENYYSKSRKAKLLGYEPQYSSIETIVNEMKYFNSEIN